MRQLLAALLQHVEDAAQHGGDHHGVGDALAGGGVHPGFRGEGRQVDHAAAAIDPGEHRRDASDVIGRHADEGGFFLAGVHELDGGDHIGRQVAMAQHGGLGLAGGAAGEQQHRDVGVDEIQLGGAVFVVQAGGFEFGAGHQDHAGDALHPRHHVVVDDSHGGRGARQELAQLVVGQAIVDRGEGLADQGAGEDGGGHGRAVEAQEHHGVAALLGQVGRAAAGAGRQFLIGHSEEGSFLASLAGTGRPSMDSEPLPGLLQRASRPVASSK